MGKHGDDENTSDHWLRYRHLLGQWNNGSAAPQIQDSWFDSVLSSLSSEAVLAMADKEGVKLFEIHGDSDAHAAAACFHKFGFVVLAQALQGEALVALQKASLKLMRICLDEQPHGDRGEFRWCLGRTTMIPDCLDAVDNHAVCKVLEKIWDSPDFLTLCTGGNFSLPGATAQNLHSDLGDRHAIASFFAYHDPVHPDRSYIDLPTPVVKVYFTLVDHDRETGPTLFVPGTHLEYSMKDVPKQEEVPAGSINAYCPKGSAILMDMRVFHKGTANTSTCARPMFAVHYAAPFYTDRVLRTPSRFWEFHRGALSLEAWKSLRLRQKQLCNNLLPSLCMECGSTSMHGHQGTGVYRRFWYCNDCYHGQGTNHDCVRRHIRTVSCTEHTGCSM